MNIYLAGVLPQLAAGYLKVEDVRGCSVLSSYWGERRLINRDVLDVVGDFLLDSGAYTFMASKKYSGLNWEEYIDEYATFVKDNGIRNYFELDIDHEIGYESVKRLRTRLDNTVGHQCIPVFHASRGKDEFLRMCDEYDYVAYGGIVSGDKDTVKREVGFFPWFIREAHRRGTRIHGLGYTSKEGLRRCHFDSVDSTSWLSGNKFGAIWRYEGGGRMSSSRNIPDCKQLVTRKVCLHNFLQWRKYQDWATGKL